MRFSRLCALVAMVMSMTVVLGAFQIAPASADAPTPSWWDGDCDANHWNLAAAGLGWTGPGAHRLGASYLGVPVCGPRRSGDGAPDVRWSKSGWGHYEWECVELAMRFMALVYGVTPYGANGNTVVANYQPSFGGGLQTVANGTVGTAPAPGDVMSFDSPSGFGHVAVVTATTVNGQGNGRVTLMTQNDTVDGWRTLAITGWQVQPFGSQAPTGWLHDPLGRGSGPTWYLRNSLTTGIADAQFTFGQPGDVAIACDWNGDGVDSPGLFRNGQWSINNQNAAGAGTTFNFGGPGDLPVCGDWNGDKVETVGVFRNGMFFLRNDNSTGATDVAVAYGGPGDLPAVGDWNGDGTTTVGVFRSGMYFLRNTNSTGLADLAFSYGSPGDRPLIGDWNGDGTDSIGIWRTGALYLHNTNTTGIADYVFSYGNPGDSPVIGDWDKAGTDKLGVVRPAS